jgi:hypothetical protein
LRNNLGNASPAKIQINVPNAKYGPNANRRFNDPRPTAIKTTPTKLALMQAMNIPKIASL